LDKNSKSVTKILFLAANPKNTGTLGLTTEIEEIRKGLRSSEQRERFELEQRFNVRPENLQQAFYDVHPQIVHFSGHGLGTEAGKPSVQGLRDISALPESEVEPEGLVFEDGLGQVKLVNTKTIADLFECFANEVECVVLNACYSVTQAEAIAQYIPYVVGMNRAVGDTAARVFAVGFYEALGNGRDIEAAFKLACNRIDLENIPESLTPVLLKPVIKTISPHTIIEPPENEVEFLFDVYISYVDKDPDSNWVWDKLLPKLEEAELRVAVSGDSERLGVTRVVNIEQGIRQAKRTVIVLSENYLSDNMAEFENTLGQTMGIQEGVYRLLPIKAIAFDSSSLPTRLSMLATLDLAHPQRADREFSRLVEALRQPLPHM
jgi:TIR domain/CHAT domain